MQADLMTQTAESNNAAANDLYARSNLTRMQMLYWTGYQLRPDVPLYAAPLVFEITQALNVDHFCAAIQSAMDQSEVLRSVIQIVDGVPQQVVRPQVAAPLIIKDFTAEENPKETARDWLLKIANTPFDPFASLVQFALAKVGPEAYLWLQNQHHIIADATSSFYVYKVIARNYERLVAPNEEIPAVPIASFEEYREYERNYRDSTQFERAKKHWQQKLDKDVEPLRFFGQPGSKKSTAINRIELKLDSERTAKLFAMAEQAEFRDLTMELTMFNLLAALFFALVHHLTGNERLAFITPMHNRPTQAMRETIGLLMELCPFVVEIEQNETLATLIQKLKKQTRGVMRFSQYGSSISLQNKAHDLTFNYHSRPSLTFNGQHIRHEHLDIDHSSESFGLHIHEFDGSGTLILKFDFHSDIFTEAQAETAVQMFTALLDTFLVDLEQPLAEIDLPWSALQPDVHQPEANLSVAKQHVFVPPRDRLELDLKNMWEAVLGVARIGIHDNYFDLGGTSWQAMNLFAEIEKLTGHYLPLATLVQAGTIAELADILRHQSGTEAWPTLVPIQEGAADQQPLYLVHGGGGHVLVFTKLARHLPDAQPVYAFQAKGLDGKTRPFTSVEEMAAHYVEALLTHQPEGPYQLGGYSMGGAVAFEMAQQLTARGHQVSFVGIIDTPAQHPALKWVRVATKWTARLLSLPPEREQMMFIKNRNRFWVGWRQLLANQVNRFRSNGNPQRAKRGVDDHNQEDVRVQKITMINNRAYYCYVPSRYPGVVTLFKSTEGYRDIYRDTQDPLMGWQRVSKSVDVHLLVGNHNEIVDEPHVQALAEAFIKALK
ncbi:MAG: alpha/beta fold hydrolase [Anaerolineales bacterium]|nr:alpha/beta fold hydrolase [Anaerolineales bacterium]